MGTETAHRALMGLERCSVSFEGAWGGREGQVPVLQCRRCGEEGAREEGAREEGRAARVRTGCPTRWGGIRADVHPGAQLQASLVGGGKGFRERAFRTLPAFTCAHTLTHTPLWTGLWFAPTNSLGCCRGTAGGVGGLPCLELGVPHIPRLAWWWGPRE